MSGNEIDFAGINRKALAMLPELLPEWLPGGRIVGDEYSVCNPRRADRHPGSFMVNLRSGIWCDFIPGGASGSDPVSLYAYLNDIRQGEAAQRVGHRVGIERANGAHYNFDAAEQKKTPIIPVPEGVPPCNWRHPQHGEPVARWAYRNADGQLLGYAARVEWIENGKPKKNILPITWCRTDHSTGHYFSWRQKGIPAPRPLYRLPELLASPGAPVVVCEGEKKADRVPDLFPGYVGTTTMHGSKAPHKSDWMPLANRNVVFWPDHDQAGDDYAKAAAFLASAAGASSIRAVALPASFPEGWDIADPLPEGVTVEMLQEMVATAPAWTIPNAADIEIITIETVKAAAGALTHQSGIAEIAAVIGQLAAVRPDPLGKSSVLDTIKLNTAQKAHVLRDTLKIAKRELAGKSRAVERGRSWVAKCQLFENGEPKPNLFNLSLALREDPEWRDVLALNKFTGWITLRKAPPWEDAAKFKERHWTDADERQATIWLQNAGIQNAFSKAVFEAVTTVAEENPFHPVHDFLDSLVWDKIPRLDDWLIRYLGVHSAGNPENLMERELKHWEDIYRYVQTIGPCFLISAVARIYTPGCKADCVLILLGAQEILKSSALQALFDPWFTDEIADFGSKDAAMQIQGIG